MGNDEIAALVHQAGIGTIAVYLIQWLKKSNWFPWLNAQSGTITRWAGLAVAFLTSVGIQHTFTGDSTNGWHVSLVIPSLSVLASTFVHAAGQFSGQQVLYHTAVKDTVGGMATKQMVQGTVQGSVVQVATGQEVIAPVAGEKK